jgi:hypothetical protein
VISNLTFIVYILKLFIVLGFFTGASVLTLIELIYFFPFRFLMNLRKVKVHPNVALTKTRRVPEVLVEYMRESSVHSFSLMISGHKVIGK